MSKYTTNEEQKFNYAVIYLEGDGSKWWEITTINKNTNIVYFE